MELDCNQEHLDRIEERIRCLEGVVFRARQHQRRQPSNEPIHITNFAGQLIVSNFQDEGRVHQEEVGIGVDREMVEGGQKGKRKATYSVARALDVETGTNKSKGCAGNMFDCNICLDKAKDPILTCCGHLFCWPCFYKLSYTYSDNKECPVCEGEVTEEGIIPIFGNASVGSSDQFYSNENGLRVPARPRSRRIESIRQRFRN